MLFKLSTIAALMLLLLSGVSLADSTCYGAGEKWSGIGTDDEVSNAFDSLCRYLVGRLKTGKEASQRWGCVNFKGNHIEVGFHLTNGVDDKKSVYMSQMSCKDALNQVKSDCSVRGGEMEGIVVEQKDDGGEWMNMQVKADPNSREITDCGRDSYGRQAALVREAPRLASSTSQAHGVHFSSVIKHMVSLLVLNTKRFHSRSCNFVKAKVVKCVRSAPFRHTILVCCWDWDDRFAPRVHFSIERHQLLASA
ncbi:hypothetical protein J7T55_015294 [Diaporthe amygdali]|uniref:uncharacterized protein n=1 Tax=Phomopsis amygdali TaxID=1214568 RepID=UPI0022FE7307|nr:uncharacterized protein J7T55_015294 [Diaporthe amygdali]KAJ0120565.1 hypothetical protein J7T55_015294 [Diaporthe amygdali]